MEIIAETKDGYMIQAKESEIREILRAVSGVKPDDIVIGQKIPAIDYASTITKIKSLKENYQFRQLLKRIDQFNGMATELTDAVEKAGEIEV